VQTLAREGRISESRLLKKSCQDFLEATRSLELHFRSLNLIPYKEVFRDKVKLPKRSSKGEHDDQATLKGRTFVPEGF